ncbi:hypothetical protein BAMBUS_01020 [Brevundimonas phage vB_BpoS-Bambus]|nr:hypothetical protein BAMBUS_01020 [Brevundimonas phage vB_BpoS-Bambus]
MSKRRRYEVWFRDEPSYLILREKTVLSMIKVGAHRHNPFVAYSVLPDGAEPRGADDPLAARMRKAAPKA